jgi:hypothetical protein
MEQQKVSPPGQSDRVTISLVDAFDQLQKSIAVRSDNAPSVSLCRISTRSRCMRELADSMQGDHNFVIFTTKDSIKERTRRFRELGFLDLNVSRAASQDTMITAEPTSSSSFWSENTKPIRVDPGVEPSKLKPLSPAAKERLRQLALDKNPDKFRDPYVLPSQSTIFETYLPRVTGEVRFELLDFEGLVGNTFCEFSGMPMLWDTGCHITTISEDLLPPEFLAATRSREYQYEYGMGDGVTIQIAIGIQSSNVVCASEGIALVRPRHTLPNNFSGIILGQHSVLDSLDYHVIPKRTLTARGMTVEDGVWGDIRVLGHVTDGVYEGL